MNLDAVEPIGTRVLDPGIPNLRPNLKLTGCFSLLLLFLSGAPQ